MLPRGVHLATAGIELLRCLLRQDTAVDDRMLNLQLTTHFLTCFYQGSPRELFLTLGFFPARFSHHGKSLDFFVREQPSREPFWRELVITGIHGIVCTGTGHHGKSSRGYLPSRELATVGIHVIFQSDFLPRKRAPRDFTRRERAILFFW